MRIVLLVLTTITISVLVSRSEEEPVPSSTFNETDVHLQLVKKYLEAQLSFKKTIETIEDEKSFDEAIEQMNEVIEVYDSVALGLKELEPPNKEDQKKFVELIMDGNSATEPTGQAMINFLMMENRKEEVQEWYNEFIRSGLGVGKQFNRLYDYGNQLKKRNEDKLKQRLKVDLKDGEIQIESE